MKKKNWSVPINLYNAFILRKYPVSLTHFVTKKCNARCPHCFIDFNNDSNELNLEQIEKIASSTGKCLANVALTGGEPILRNDIFEIADIWYKNSTVKSLFIPSNGSMPDRIEGFIKKADKNNLPVSFCFSYDFIEEKHSEYRKINDLHLKLQESYKIIKSYKDKFNVSFQITLNPENVNSANETYNYIKEKINPDNISCILYRGKEADNLDKEKRSELAVQYENIQKQINNDFKRGSIKGYTKKSIPYYVLNTKNNMYWKDILETFKNNTFLYPCMAGKLFGIISENGDVYPCELLNKSFGNLKNYDYNFMALWNNIDAKKINKFIKESKCRCTFECVWVVNTFSQIKNYPKIACNLLKTIKRR